MEFAANTTGIDLEEVTSSASSACYPAQCLVQAASHLLTFRVGMAIQRYYLPVIIIIGFIGNFLSLAVMSQRHNRRVSCCVYMGALAVTDTMSLFVAAYYWCLTDAPPPVGRPMTRLECRILGTWWQCCQMSGVYFIVMMTIDRMIAIRFPFKASRLCTPRRAYISILIILVISSALNALHFYKLIITGDGKVCVGLTDKDAFTVAYSWTLTILNCFIPFSAILSLNTSIIRSMRAHISAKQGHLDVSNDKMRSSNYQLTIMLLAVTFAFILLCAPHYMRIITYSFKSFTSSPRDYAMYILAAHGSNKLFFTNNAVNFFLYCIGGSKFRADLRELLCLRRFSCGHRRDGNIAVYNIAVSNNTENTGKSLGETKL